MGFFEANYPKILPSSRESHHSSGALLSADLPRLSSRRRTVSNALPLAVMRAAVDQKGLDVRGLDIATSSDFADFFVIISGTSERHVRGIADKIQEALVKLGERAQGVNGYEKGEWILIDYGDLIAHVFYEPKRQYYGLDELWGKRSTVIEPGPELVHNMRMLRTGIAW